MPFWGWGHFGLGFGALLGIIQVIFGTFSGKIFGAFLGRHLGSIWELFLGIVWVVLGDTWMSFWDRF